MKKLFCRWHIIGNQQGKEGEYTFDVHEETWKIGRGRGRKMTIALILVEIFTVIMQRNVCEKHLTENRQEQRYRSWYGQPFILFQM